MSFAVNFPIACVVQIRSHAAAALLNLDKRHLYGPLWRTALQTCQHAADELSSSKGEDDLADSGT